MSDVVLGSLRPGWPRYHVEQNGQALTLTPCGGGAGCTVEIHANMLLDRTGVELALLARGRVEQLDEVVRSRPV